jgi:hypothetical protein
VTAAEGLPIEEINHALADLRENRGIRTVPSIQPVMKDAG